MDQELKDEKTLDIVESEVAWYRWRWFFLVTFLFISPVAIIIGLTGDIYAKDHGEVSILPELTKKLLMIAGIFLFIGSLNRFM